MTALELENTTDATTESWSTTRTASDQRDPATRRVLFDAFIGEMETRGIERNRAFHATIVSRIATAAPALIDADELLSE